MRRYTLLLIGILLGWFPWVGHSETAVRTDIQLMDHYLRARYDWALADFGKPGLEQSHAKHV